MTGVERFDVVVVGAGQAGLAVGHYLAAQGRSFVILEAAERVGDSWRHRWDSLLLFTPARYSGLPGVRYPGPAWSFPGKDDIAGFLEQYARRFDLPVRTGVRVDRLTADGDRYVLEAGADRFLADNVVVATGAFHAPRIPDFASALDPSIRQLHSSEYRNPSHLRDGGVLVVGSGNSGAEIALEVCRMYPTWLSGKDTGQETPLRHGSLPDRALTPLLWFLFSRVVTTHTAPGRKLRHRGLTRGTPLLRVKPKDLAAAGIERVPRTVGMRDGHPVLEDGRGLRVANVIWCTGFRPDYGWIELPVFGEDGLPRHDRGVVTSQPGLYFVGLFFQTSLTSSLIGGVGRDASHVAHHLTSRPEHIRLR